MQPPPRPPAINAVSVTAATIAGLTIASWVLHLEFSRRFGQLGLAAHGRIGGVSVTTLSRIGEPGKALALVGVGAILILRARGGFGAGRGRARVAVVIGMVGAAAAHGLAALYDGGSVLVGFFLAALASAANALSGRRGLPGAGTLDVGLAAVAVDVASIVLAVTCVALLVGRSARAEVGEDPATEPPAGGR